LVVEAVELEITLLVLVALAVAVLVVLMLLMLLLGLEILAVAVVHSEGIVFKVLLQVQAVLEYLLFVIHEHR
jgi:hypothetical protein